MNPRDPASEMRTLESDATTSSTLAAVSSWY
jgi:hypothetical protein